MTVYWDLIIKVVAYLHSSPYGVSLVSCEWCTKINQTWQWELSLFDNSHICSIRRYQYQQPFYTRITMNLYAYLWSVLTIFIHFVALQLHYKNITKFNSNPILFILFYLFLKTFGENLRVSFETYLRFLIAFNDKIIIGLFTWKFRLILFILR
jgi:hypothetical protein